MIKYNLVAESTQSTVVGEYIPSDRQDNSYQTEAELEKAFIRQLTQQAYTYINIRTEQDLIANLRVQLEKLNDYHFTDHEWKHFFEKNIANQSNGIKEKTKIIQEDHIQLLHRDNGTTKNIFLLDKKNIHNNVLQVINQYETSTEARLNRYDVTILVNGIPLVHIELKRRGIDIKEAFNQINRYQQDSFWAGSGLFEYIQIFVISNGTHTKYYSNTTRQTHIAEASSTTFKKGIRTSNSFEFTSWWADANNKTITDLIDFTKTFFAKHTLLNILTKYCVFTVEELLLVMRPYQIVATEKILERIKVAGNYKLYGKVDGGGYIWHTTGSGKTLTSFKTAQLVSQDIQIKKVLFVVDRKDLDYQTMREYDKFAKGAANSNTSTAVLQKQLEDDDCHIIITTIQKLAIFIKKNKNHPIYEQQIVIIFDECHRSQFGEMHQQIIRAFKKYHLFGFTGTPIFAANASSGGKPDFKTTQQAFGDKLHTYTIIDAIADKNVLPFKVEYYSTLKEQENIQDEKVFDIDREKALAAPQRIKKIVEYILKHFNQKTMRNCYYKLKDRRLQGFNSIFAVSSIDVAKKYYTEFKKQMELLKPDDRLKIALIYSFGVNDDEYGADGVCDENMENTEGLDKSSRDFLDAAIKDFNKTFKTNFDTSSKNFPNYYKDISKRVKDRELDLLIVVNMFLTGFDATTLNTLWVDKNLRLQGLLQAFSRTNRILNSVKTFGNIVCFRNLEKATNESLALFGNKEAKGVVLLKTFNEYYHGYTNADGNKIKGYAELVKQLLNNFPIGKKLISEKTKKDFINLYGSILRIKNILSTFDEFLGKEILSARDVQDYQSIYIDLYNERGETQKNIINDDIVFEIELIKQVEINIDYILILIKKYHAGQMKDKELIITIQKSIDSSLELKSKKDLISNFISSLTPISNIDVDWKNFVEKQKISELDKIIKDENLNKEETYKYMENAFKDGFIQTTGTAITKILPKMSRFSKTDNRSMKKETVLRKIISFFNRFKGISIKNA